MVKCNKCFIDKPQDQYYQEKRFGKIYYKKYCLDCFRAQSREWKRQNKLKKQQMIDIPQQEEIVQPVVPESQQEVLEHRVCRDCKELKPITEFHPIKQGNLSYHYRNCKTCYKEKQLKTRQENNPFGQLYRPKPNQYMNDHQKEKTFELMEALGWIFDEATGIWNKPGLKEDGKFLNIVPQVKIKHKRVVVNVYSPKRDKLLKCVDEIIKYREDGVSFEDLEDIYGCSHTTIRRVVNDYYYERARRTR